MRIPFEPPDWLKNQTAEKIQQHMMQALPSDMDNTEGGFPWDFTMPTALEASELLQFYLVETIKLMFPQWAYGTWLDSHAKTVNLTRKAANAAYGKITITGIPGTEIPAGFRFAVPAVGSMSAVEFASETAAIIGADGKITLGISAVEAGSRGNVPADTITMMARPIQGITKISNKEKTSGGTEEETDDSLRERIAEAESAVGGSFVGCNADYIRWAKEMDGVGDVFVIPQWDPDIPNSVKVVVLDANGEPANDKILADVYENIMSPHQPLFRKAPIGAIVTITAPTMVPISYVLNAILCDGYEVSAVREEIEKRVKKYYTTIKTENIVKYNEIHALITETPGIYDFTQLTINGKTENIILQRDEYPATENLDLHLSMRNPYGT